ncbi:anti-sigma-D factor RsdA [Micromonospora psammae]|uniref:anti-sigma-D factor RsdA n=1 Tax=Micromonospora sp. CPCC 205556 TaxID=3122398 RepID=UPI002FEFF724
MSERWPDDGAELDLGTVAHDDLLLDALGRGGAESDGDDLTAMLAAWRDDVAAGVDELEWVAGTPDPDHAQVRPDAPPAPALAPIRPLPLRRRALRLAAAVAAALVLVTGLGIGSRDAGPASPLWSLTKVLHPERAEVRVVEETIARAREAAAAGRFEEARQLVDQARRELAGVGDPAEAARLLAELDAVLGDLTIPACPTWPRCAASTPPPTPLTPPATTSPSGGPASTRPPTPRPAAPRPPTPKPTSKPTPASGGNLLPSLPELPLPTEPKPRPSVSLPELPLPTVDLIG